MDGMLLGSEDISTIEELIPETLKKLLAKIIETMPGDRFMIDVGTVESPEGDKYPGFSIFPTNIERIADEFVARVCVTHAKDKRVVLVVAGSGKTTVATLKNKDISEEEADNKTLNVVHDCLIPQEIRS